MLYSYIRTYVCIVYIYILVMGESRADFQTNLLDMWKRKRNCYIKHQQFKIVVEEFESHFLNFKKKIQLIPMSWLYAV